MIGTAQRIRPGCVHILLPLRYGYAQVLLHGLR